MKLITLNVWGGRKEELLTDFFARYRNEVDIFCLQEVICNGEGKITNLSKNNPKFFTETADILANYVGYFRPAAYPFYGLATFVRQDIAVLKEDDVFVFGEYRDSCEFEAGEEHPRNIQHLKIATESGAFVVHNFHGMWTKKGKIDTPARLKQAENVAAHLESIGEPQIIAGDFNMRPEIESMQIIESVGLRNLVTEFGVKDTRTSFYPKEERFADYILTSDGITVNDFTVLPDEVSDHAALLLDFDVTT